MKTPLPPQFLNKMQTLLEDEFPQFLESYNEPRYYGLRVNSLKLSAERFAELAPFSIKPIPWTDTGFYYDESERPGKHPYYHAGLYYIQEPSAMAPVQLLDPQPGDKVLDLCAAPGGKSIQIAAKLQGYGIIVANDISSDRVKALVKNIELAGVRNAVVLNEQPSSLIPAFPAYFDKILIDAPCSGEGMFRKDEEMAKSWEKHSVEKCAVMQREILEQAAELLAPGGLLVYSTCTFSPEENEAQIASFLDRHPGFAVVPPSTPAPGFAAGRPEWARLRDPAAPPAPLSSASAEAVSGTVRLWPHRLHGEGHFVAVLRDGGASAPAASASAPAALPAGKAQTLQAAPSRAAAGGAALAQAARRGRSEAGRRGGSGAAKRADGGMAESACIEAAEAFLREHTAAPQISSWNVYGSHVYACPQGLPSLNGLKVARPGWFIGTVKPNRFEPSQALALGLGAEDVFRRLDLSSNSAECLRYLKGETLEIPEDRMTTAENVTAKGYCLVCVDGFPVGWGKWQNGILKNEYPPGWRWT